MGSNGARGHRDGQRAPFWAAAFLAVAACLTALGGLSGGTAQAQTATQYGAPSFGSCERAVDEFALRSEVFDGARAAMAEAARSVDYERLVEASWLAVRFDSRFADIVDAKIAILREDRAYLERLLDGNVPSRAQEMAERSAELVFNSPEFERLSKDLQTEIGARLEPLVAEAELETRSEAAACVRTFLGARYADTVRTAFGDGASADLRPIGGPGASVGTSAAVNLAGIVAAMLTVVFRRLVRRIVASVVRRLAGAIAARLAAWASVVIGVVVLVYELVAGADGVFPVIRDELTSPETKQEIQAGLIDELRTVGPEELDTRAQAIAGEMFDRWRAFRESHRSTLELAEAEPSFQRFLSSQPPDRFEALSIVVAAIKAEPPGGDAAVMEALDRGLLSRALSIPGIGLQLESWSPRGLSLQDLIAWSDAAGPDYERALDYGLPAVLSPRDLAPGALASLLAIPDNEAARRIAAMPEPARGDALALGPDAATRLATRFDSAPLARFFDALRSVPRPDQRQDYLERVIDRPGLMDAFSVRGAADAVSGSAEPGRAMDLMLSSGSLWAPWAFYSHVDAVLEGQVSALTLPYRYGWGLAIGFGVPLLIGLWFVRGVLGMVGLRRRRA